MTVEGNIIVDGVLASCYDSVNHDVAHIGMKPMQWFPDIIQWVFGEDDRFSAFAKTVKYLEHQCCHMSRSSNINFQNLKF